MEAQMLQVLNPENLRTLEEWLQKTQIRLTQVNGQRKYGGPPPGWTGPTPGPGCEVFISQIPRDIYEDRLIPLFQSVAPLYEFRLMMNFSGQNRGFAYAKYADPCSATAAISALHLYPLQAGVKLTVRRSTEKKQLCLDDLPVTMQRKDLLEVLRQISEGVVDVTLKASGHKGTNICAVVDYSSHYAASMAKKILIQAFRRIYGVSISVRWMSCTPKSRRGEQGKETPLAPPGLKPLAKNFQTLSHFQLNPDPLCPSPQPPPLHLQSFHRAVGDPTLQMGAMMVPHKPRSTGEPFGDFLHQLRRLCELKGLGLPVYKVQYHHTGPDGFLCFTYRVEMPGLPIPLCGVVHILPSTCGSDLEAEVHQAVAERLLKTTWEVRNP